MYRRNIIPLMAATVLIAACSRIGMQERQLQAGMQTMEMRLQAIADGRAEPTDFMLVLNEMDRQRGETTFTVHGDGRVQRDSLSGTSSTAAEVRVPKQQLQDLIRELIAIDAWEQQQSSRAAQPEEPKATLAIHIGAMQSEIWEWQSEMQTNQRMIKVRLLLQQAMAQ